MNRRKLTIYIGFPAPRLASRKHSNPADDLVYWITLGIGLSCSSDFQKNLPAHFRSLFITKLLNDVADIIRPDFAEWVDALNDLNGGSLAWWFGRVSSRSIYSSDLFHSCCYIELLNRLFDSEGPSPEFIVVQSTALARTIKSWADKKGLEVTIHGGGWRRISETLRKLARQLLDPFYFACRVSAARLSHNSVQKYAGGKTVLVDVFVDKASIAGTGPFVNRHLPRLDEYLKKAGYRVVYSPVFYGFAFGYLSAYKKLRDNPDMVLVPEDYLRWSDYLEAFYVSLTQFFVKPLTTPFRGNCFRYILYAEQYSGVEILNALLIYKLVARLKLGGFAPEYVIEWYENQIVDKASIKGFHDHFPGLKVIGVQSFVHTDNIVSEFPINSEFKNGFVPDLMLCTSQYQCDRARMYAPAVTALPSAALRYAHLFGVQPPRKEERGKVVGVLGSCYPGETLALIELMNDAEPLIAEAHSLLFRCHPAYNKDMLLAQVGHPSQVIAKFEFSESSLAEFISECDVIVSYNSSAAVESASRAVPVVFACLPGSLIYNPLRGVAGELASEAHDPTGLAAEISKYLRADVEFRERYAIEAGKIKELFFTPIDDNSLKYFLPQ